MVLLQKEHFDDKLQIMSKLAFKVVELGSAMA